MRPEMLEQADSTYVVVAVLCEKGNAFACQGAIGVLSSSSGSGGQQSIFGMDDIRNQAAVDEGARRCAVNDGYTGRIVVAESLE